MTFTKDNVIDDQIKKGKVLQNIPVSKAAILGNIVKNKATAEYIYYQYFGLHFQFN